MSLYQCIRQLVNSNFKLLRNLWMNFSFCLTRQNIEQKIPWSKNWLWPCYAIDTTYILLCWSLKSLLNIYFLAFKCFTRVCRYIFNSFSEELKKKLWITNLTGYTNSLWDDVFIDDYQIFRLRSKWKNWMGNKNYNKLINLSGSS